MQFGEFGLRILSCAIILVCQPFSLTSGESPHGAHESHSPIAGSQQHDLPISGWDGSAEGKAYSEFNHRLAGALVILIGVGELRGGFSAALLPWTRFLLPGSMLGAGSYLLVWSDHDAWPIGPETFMETFFGDNFQTMQHKLYALLLLTVGSIEWFKRSGRLSVHYWSWPLPVFAMIGGLLLFLHSHSDHPSAHEIARHHAIMGVTALMAGSCLVMSEYAVTGSAKLASVSQRQARWKLAWSVLVLIIGVQLLAYAE